MRTSLALVLMLTACAPRQPPHRTTLRLPTDDDIVSVHVAVRAGSVDDPVGKEGLTHLMLHLMREGGAGPLDAYEVRQKLFDTAAELEVAVDREVSVITLRAHRDVLDEVLPLLDAMLTSPRLEVRAFDRLRRDALDAIRHSLRSTEEEWLAEEALNALVYAGHPYGHPVIGTEEGLGAISLADVVAARGRILCASRVTIGVTGRVREGIETTLASRLAPSEACRARARLPLPTANGPRVLIVSHPTARAATVRMLAPYAVTRAHRDHPALVLFAGYLGLSGQFIGRLMQSIREHRGLNYGDYAYAEHTEPNPSGRGPVAHAVRSQQGFEIMLRPMSPTHVPFVTRLVFRELSLALEGVPAQGLSAVAEFLDGYLPLWLETADARLGSALDQAFFGLTTPFIEGLRRAFVELDAQDVTRAARRHIDPNAMRVVIVTDDAIALREALLAARIESVVYDHPVSAEVTAEDLEIVAFPLGLTPADIAIVDVEALFVR
jgi:zinc protease